jgi:hypothetical protein
VSSSLTHVNTITLLGACSWKNSRYWIMDAVASHLAEIGTQGSFVLLCVQVSDGRALMLYKDVNGSESARQEVPDMDFPRNSTSLYACRHGEHWVIVLPSDY